MRPPDSHLAAFLVSALCHRCANAAVAIAWLFPIAAAGMDFLNDVQEVFTRLAPAAVVVRIRCDSVTGVNEHSPVPVAVKHDPLALREVPDSFFG